MRITAAVLITITLLAAHGPARAAEADLTGRLRALIREGERRRAADRWFLDVLRAILRRYRRAPGWQVASGRFDVTRRMGLTSIVEVRGESPPAEKQAEGDFASALLGELLERSLRGKGRGALPGASDRAEIFLPRKISNAFTFSISNMHDSASRLLLPCIPQAKIPTLELSLRAKYFAATAVAAPVRCAVVIHVASITAIGIPLS